MENLQAELIGFCISYMCGAISGFLADMIALYASLIVSSSIIDDAEMDPCGTK